MKVLKFGGSSLAGAEQVKKIIPIIQNTLAVTETIVVVSAMEGVTNQLLRIAEHAEKGISSWKGDWAALVDRHISALMRLIDSADGKKYFISLQALFSQTLPILEQLFEQRRNTRLNMPDILAIGEKMSAQLVSAALQNAGIAALPVYADAFLITEGNRLNADVYWPEAVPKVQAFFSGLKKGTVPVVTGFIGRNRSGQTTVLGRNGSDYTASVLAACLKAESVEFCTDVDGVRTADPRRVADSGKVSCLSFTEADILAELGTDLLHPRTLKPLIWHRIPCRIRSTFLPESTGTYVSEKPPLSAPPWKSIAAVSNCTEWLIKTESSANARQYLSSIQEFGIHPAAAVSENGDLRLVLPESENSHLLKRMAGATEISRQATHRSVVVLVGKRLHLSLSLAEGLNGWLHQNHLPHEYIATDLPNRICLVVKDEHLPSILSALHRFLFEDIRLLPLIIAGYRGNVGKAFMAQLKQYQAFCLAQYGIWPQVWELRNSRASRKLWNGNDLSTPSRLLPPALVDITASQDLAESYPKYLQKGVHVVTANKLGLTQPLGQYRLLRQYARESGAKLKYECTVGAATPFVGTVRHIRQKGDALYQLEGVFSGTIASILADLHGGKPFSVAVKDAWREGLTEPHPAADLSGTDVQRKLLILLRESGLPLNPEDISVESLLPPEIPANLRLEEFFKKLTEYDAIWEKRVKQAAQNKQVLTYLAEFDGRSARVGLKEVPADHPFSRLGKNQNALRLFTHLHREVPLFISGAGAGRKFTARGLWQDLLEILEETNSESILAESKSGEPSDYGVHQQREQISMGKQ